MAEELRPVMGLTTLEAAGVSLTAGWSGDGPAVLFVHGPALAATMFDATRSALGDDLRAVAYDRRAYGASPTYEPFRGTTVSEQAEDAVAIVEGLQLAPALIVGFDVGSLIALDLILRHRPLVRGAVLVEPALLSLVAAGRETVAELRQVVAAGARDAGGGGAVEAYLEHVGGAGTVARLGHDRLNAARQNARAFAADLAAGPGWRYTPRELRAIEAPVTVVSGGRTAPARRAASSELAGLVPGAVLVELDAGHLVPLDDPDGLARVVRERS